MRFPGAVTQTRGSFQSGGKNITAEQFVPSSGKPSPIVLALHGSGGPPESGASEAKALAGQGYIVLAPLYFERTGHTWAQPEEIEPNFETWMSVVQDAIGYALSLPNNTGKLGLLGFSLGAYLALSVATSDERVNAVVDFFGGLPDVLYGTANRMPPVLILHGEADPVVPFSQAQKLQRWMAEKNFPYEMKSYPGAGHSFSGLDMMDAATRTLAFLDKNLR